MITCFPFTLGEIGGDSTGSAFTTTSGCWLIIGLSTCSFALGVIDGTSAGSIFITRSGCLLEIRLLTSASACSGSIMGWFSWECATVSMPTVTELWKSIASVAGSALIQSCPGSCTESLATKNSGTGVGSGGYSPLSKKLFLYFRNCQPDTRKHEHLKIYLELYENWLSPSYQQTWPSTPPIKEFLDLEQVSQNFIFVSIGSGLDNFLL